MPNPVVGGDEAGDDGGAGGGGAVLPVAEGFVAGHPDPLSIDGVAERGVGVEG